MAFLNTFSSGNFTFSNSNKTIERVGTGWCQAILDRIPTGKIYVEFLWQKRVIVGSEGLILIGIISSSAASATQYPGQLATGYGYFDFGPKYNNGASYTFGSSYAENAIISIAYDSATGKIWWAKNGIWQASGNPAVGGNPAFANISGEKYISVGVYRAGNILTVNYSSRYPVPAGFSPLYNLPLQRTFRVLNDQLLQRTFRVSHGLVPSLLKNFRALCGAVPVRLKTFRVRTEQARTLQKVFRVVTQQLTVLQKVFRVVTQQQHGVLMTVFRAVHGSTAGAALMTVFRAVHGLVADTFRSDDFDVSLSVGNQQVLSWTAATLSADEGRYVWEAAVAVRNDWDTNLLHQFAHVVYHRYGVDYHLIVTDTARSLVVDDQGYTDSWVVQMASPAYMLSSSAALPITKTWPRGSAARAIVQELCDLYQITLNWQHPEYVIGELVAEKQAPIDIIKAVLNVSGALVQSEPSGALLVRLETPVLPDADAIPNVTFPALSLVSLADEGDDPSILYNAVLVSDSDEAVGAGGLLHEETDRADGGKDIKAWAEPWAEITLRPNASAVEVQLTAHGVQTETKEEWLEFVDGVATSSKPPHEGLTLLDVHGAAPGVITWLPDSKALTAAAGAEHYCLVRYTWRYYAFTYYSLSGDDYQLVLED